jgi:uncharacterized membrane protein
MRNKFDRFWRHFSTDHRSARRAFPPHTLTRIGSAIATGEQTHSGQVRFVVEAALPLSLVLRDQKPRGHALDVFSRLRIWDTEENIGVLVYVLLADKAVEIADRGIHRRVGDAAWESICRTMEAAFRNGGSRTARSPESTRSTPCSRNFPRTGSTERARSARDHLERWTDYPLW